MRDKGKSRPVARREKGDRFGISIGWDDYMISGMQNSTDEVQRLIWIVGQLKKDYPELYAGLMKTMPPLGHYNLPGSLKEWKEYLDALPKQPKFS